MPFLFGVNNHEFGWLIPRGWGLLEKMDQLSLEDMLAILRPFLTNMDVPTEVMSTIIKEYLGSSSDGQAKREGFQELLSDGFITLPMLQFARHLQDSGVSIFFYEFQHRPSSFAKIKPAWVRADHAAELTFMFGGPFLTDESSMLAFPEATEEEQQLSLTMMAQWTNFAWTGLILYHLHHLGSSVLGSPFGAEKSHKPERFQVVLLGYPKAPCHP